MSTEFSNPPIDVGDLPQVDTHPFEPLHPNFLRAKMAGAALTFGAIVLVVAVVASFVQSEGGRTAVVLVAGGVALLLTVLTAVLQRIAIRYMGYLVREHDLSYRYGVLSRTTQTIPFTRVQHVSIDRGPVERRLGLATLRLRSAGGVIAIAGLSVEAATRLREVVVTRADVDTDDTDDLDDSLTTEDGVTAAVDSHAGEGGVNPPLGPAAVPPPPSSASAAPPSTPSAPPPSVSSFGVEHSKPSQGSQDPSPDA